MIQMKKTSIIIGIIILVILIVAGTNTPQLSPAKMADHNLIKIDQQSISAKECLTLECSIDEHAGSVYCGCNGRQIKIKNVE
jgi:hypothetical protein